jgi:hypothetical protein
MPPMLSAIFSVCALLLVGGVIGFLTAAERYTKKYTGRPVFIGPNGEGLDEGVYRFTVENREHALISIQRVEKHGPVDYRRLIILGAVNGHTYTLPEVFNEESGLFSFKHKFNDPEWKKVDPFAFN